MKTPHDPAEPLYAPGDAAAAGDTSPSADSPSLAEAHAPSEEFVRAVSDFLDTDPADLLHELGYYDRTGQNKPALLRG